MGTYTGTARTNFFRVVDRAAADALEDWCERTSNKLHCHPTVPLCYMVSGQDDSGDFNFTYEDEEGDEVSAWWDSICHVLAEGECLVAMASGAEKLCYVSGHAVAMKADGSHVEISLTDIYALALKTLGVSPTPAEYTSHSVAA